MLRKIFRVESTVAGIVLKPHVEKSSTFSIQYSESSKYLSTKRGNSQTDFDFICKMFKTVIATDELLQWLFMSYFVISCTC